MFVTFDPKCRTREFYAKLQIIGRANNGKPQSFEFHGDKFPQKAFKVYGNKIQYKFQSVGGNDDESWGFRFTVAPLNEIDLDEPFDFNGIAYGGCNDRIYKYDKTSPTDIPWLARFLTLLSRRID